MDQAEENLVKELEGIEAEVNELAQAPEPPTDDKPATVTDDDKSGEAAKDTKEQKAEGPAPDAPADEPGAKDGDEEEIIPKKRFNEVYGKYKQTERERDYWREQAKAKAEAAKADADDTEGPSLPQRPKEEDFEDYEQYEDALTDWRIDVREVKRQQSQAEESKTETIQKLVHAASQKAQEDDDFKKAVLESNNVPWFVPQNGDEKGAARFLTEIAKAGLEDPLTVLHYLGKNPDKAFDLADSLKNPIAFGRKLTLIEMESKGPTPPPRRTETKAPEPIDTVDGNEPLTVDLENMDMDKFVKYWNKRDYGKENVG